MTAPARGIAGRLAAAFIDSRLTPLIVITSILAGAGAIVLLPREEEPQIVVPMIDVFVEMPGATVEEVEERVTRPMEQLIWEIPGVEYVYSTSSAGRSMVIVRFLVGEDEEDSIVRLNQKLAANADRIPPGVGPPLVQPRSINDVPILALTLSSAVYDHAMLDRIAGEVRDAVKQVPDVSEIRILGGRGRQISVVLDPERMAAYAIDPASLAGALQAANTAVQAGSFSSANRQSVVRAGEFFGSADEIGDILVASVRGRTVRLEDVAEVRDGPAELTQYVLDAPGAGGDFGSESEFLPAVTISLAKRAGTNAIDVARAVLEKADTLRGTIIPSEVTLTITRNYGETAAEKSNELLFHMLIAIFSVAGLVWLVLGHREAAIVVLAIPVTLALTLVVFYLYGYTLNRVTLFALIFSIGILVDDAIVVVENIVRHMRLPRNRNRPAHQVAVEAVDEVGNPTILATFAVVAAILPMAFVRGLMGPYMEPIPVGASAAMLFSLVIAFVVTPWAGVRLLSTGTGHAEAGESRSTRLYRTVMGSLLHNRTIRYGFLLLVVGSLVGALSLVGLRMVRVKMLPFDNKSEFQVIVDMPEGTTLEETGAATRAIAGFLRTVPDVANLQLYVGTSSPYNFNGLVRHYFLREGPAVADIQVNLVGKDERDAESHVIARGLRPRIQEIAADFNANVKVSEVPPGPPVLQTLVAEIYGPDDDRQVEVAAQIREIFERTGSVVDVDWYVEEPQPQLEFVVDREKAALLGISTEHVARTIRMALGGMNVGLLHDPRAKQEVPIVLRLPRAERSSAADLGRIRIQAPATGTLVPLSSMTTVRERTTSRNIYHKNLMPVVYVTGDVAGEEESPLYAILEMNAAIDQLSLPEGYGLERYVATQPADTNRLAMKWDGEWHISYEVFRDLGIAFAAVLVLIYILVTGWFQSFTIPLTIMSAIPFSLVGILPAHMGMGAFFTATSMIGFIAGAGIVVRNSIILVDFIQIRLDEGMPLDEAVIDAGAVRFRPMLLTAAAVIVGASVILFDPIFQGLAISLMAGEVASLLLSRMTVPVLFFIGAGRRAAGAGGSLAPDRAAG